MSRHRGRSTQTRRTASCLKPIQQVGPPTHARSTDRQKCAKSCMIAASDQGVFNGQSPERSAKNGKTPGDILERERWSVIVRPPKAMVTLAARNKIPAIYAL